MATKQNFNLEGCRLVILDFPIFVVHEGETVT